MRPRCRVSFETEAGACSPARAQARAFRQVARLALLLATRDEAQLICPSGCFANRVSSPICKNVSVFPNQNQHYNSCRPVPSRGAYRDRHERWVMDPKARTHRRENADACIRAGRARDFILRNAG
jgi:hypothetical protein